MAEDFVYLDNSATTKPCDRAVSYMTECAKNNWGNPSSLHICGINAEVAVENARQTAAKLLGVSEDEIYFTSGGTESNNIAVLGAVHAKKRLGKKCVTTAIEHPSVLEAFKQLESEGFSVVYLKPDENGTVPLCEFKSAIDQDTVLVSSMLVNNETGAVLPVCEIKKIIKQNGSNALLHCDCVQAFGKTEISAKRLGVDLVSASAHKIHGVKGTGILFVDRNARINPTVFGGGQEKGLRSGTENTVGIAALLGAMEEININSDFEKVSKLNGYLREKLRQTEDIEINSSADCLPYILNFSVLGYRSEILLHYLESMGVYVSSGSACAKGNGSYVLNAMGLSSQRVDSALRVSFSKDNTFSDIDALINAVISAKQKLKKSK